ERLLPRLVDELRVGLTVLALVSRVRERPRLDLGSQVAREVGVIVEEVLEAGREMDLRRLDLRELMEELLGKGRGPVLDGPGETVLARHAREALERAEVELHLGHATARQRHPAVRRPGLDAD